MKKKLAKLEAIRAFAALYILFGHSFNTSLLQIGDFYFGDIFRFGSQIVIIFFILSGFVIQYSFEKSNDKSFKIYFLKRFLRIYIPLLCVFAANAFLLLIRHRADYIDLGSLVGNLFMFQDLSLLKRNVICEPFLGNQPLWSLSYEWWFYMLFFPIVTFFNSKSSKIIYICALVACVTYLFYPFFINRIFLYMAIWWMGVEMAKMYSAKGKIIARELALPLSVLIICMLVLRLSFILSESHLLPFTIYKAQFEFDDFFAAILIILTALIWNKFNWRFFGQTIGIFTPFAKISYGIYISHWFLVAKATYLSFIPYSIVRFVLYCMVCFVFSYIVECIIYVKVNKIVMNYLNKRKSLN